MKMRRSIQSFLILSLTFLGNFAFSTTKKTVCSITINSSNEVDQFKKHFSSKDWNFVELVPKTDETQTNNSNQANDKHWLEDSCRPDIQCDILVISGHFSGSFFGKISRDLSLNSIESLSCSDHCSGIFQRPKEVFLFGCNTLASKEKDHRSPQEYLNVLIDEHNFTREQASQMAAFRYSEWGQSFRGRMAGAFAQSPRIYGFSSVAPSGPNIEPAIQHYLKITKGEYSDFSAYNTRLKTQTNMKLMSSLKNFSITQVAGSQALQKTPQPAPYCQLWDKKRSRLERIKYMQLLLDSDQAIALIHHIEQFISDVRTGEELTPEEDALFLQISRNQALRIKLESVLEMRGNIYFSIRTKAILLLKELGLVDTQTIQKIFWTKIAPPMNEKLWSSDVELICSLGIQTDLSAVSIPEARWKESNFFQMLRCLKPQDIKTQERLIDIVKFSDPESFGDMGSDARSVLVDLRPTSVEIQRSILSFLFDNKEGSRLIAWEILRKVPLADPRFAVILREAFLTHNNSDVRKSASYLLRVSDPRLEETINYLENQSARAVDPQQFNQYFTLMKEAAQEKPFGQRR